MSKVHAVSSFIQLIQQQVVINRGLCAKKYNKVVPLLKLNWHFFLIHIKNTLIEDTKDTKLYKDQAVFLLTMKDNKYANRIKPFSFEMF